MSLDVESAVMRYLPSRSDANNGERPFVIVHVGAGACSELEKYFRLRARRIVLVEADPEEVRKLTRRVGGRSDIEILSLAVAESAGSRKLRVFNSPGWNSLRNPTGLRELFPGLRQVREAEVETVSVAELMQQIGLTSETTNWVVLDAPGEEMALLRGLSKAGYFSQIERIVLHCGQRILYEGAEASDALLTFLQEHGYDISPRGGETDKDPDLHCWVARKNPQRLENIALRARVEMLQKQLDEQGQLAAREIDQYQVATTRHKLLAEELRLAMDRLTHERDTLGGLIEEYRRHISWLEGILGKRLEKLEAGDERVREILDGQQKGFQRISKEIGGKLASGLKDAVRKVVSRMALENYLNGNDIHPQTQGWTISADFALYIANHIQMNDYDCIVEFGSGTSTVVMAVAMSRMQERHQSEDDGGGGGRQRKFPRILAFEHDLKYCERTAEELRLAGVSSLVDLVHAKLRDYTSPEGERFLYYSCEERIMSLARHLGDSEARILILVDGPPGSTGKDARYPALPICLQFLGMHQLNLLLDDYVREDEKEIVRRWKCMLEQSSCSYSEEELEMEKGAYLLSLRGHS